jgi:hypothetical protein
MVAQLVKLVVKSFYCLHRGEGRQRTSGWLVTVVSWTVAEGLDPGVGIYVHGQDN